MSFGELLLIGVVALVVLGPERLPKVAHTVGVILGRLQRYVSDVKADVQREIDAAGLQQLHHDVTQAAHDLQYTIHRDTASSTPETEQSDAHAGTIDNRQLDLFADTPSTPSSKSTPPV